MAKLVNLQHDNEMAVCFMLRACAVPPPDVVTMYLGASNVHFLTNVVGGVMGSFPCMVLTTLLGANIRDPASPAFWQVIALRWAVKWRMDLLPFIADKSLSQSNAVIGVTGSSAQS